MFGHPARATRIKIPVLPGRTKLTLAQVMVFCEAFLRGFAQPLFFLGAFAALAWLGVFEKLYPYAHLVALILFFLLTFKALGQAAASWQAPKISAAKRRVEEASHLRHRPLDVLSDQPTSDGIEAQVLWQAHTAQAREQVKNLRWPHFKLDWAKEDPHKLRYVLGALLTIGLITGWGALGGRMIAAINPALGKASLSTVTIDAWITPPAYTHLSPIMIATPAGDRLQGEVIKVPEGSVLHAHLAEKDGDAPILDANNTSTEFAAEDGKDFDVAQIITGGDTVSIHRGWMTLGSWRIHVIPDGAPQVAFTEQPSSSERKSVRIAYDAKDDYGVTSVKLRLIPKQTIAGIENGVKEFPLSTPNSKDAVRIDFKDLTAEPWAGLPVDLQLVATDEAGHQTESARMAMTLPERDFFQPIARMLIDERKKLLQNVFDIQTLNETANLMAGVAKQPATYGADPLVMMALRAGAVRLVLEHDQQAALSANNILWETATRIEDGAVGMAEQNLHKAQQDLADALDNNASEKEIQSKIDRLHQALAQYLSHLSNKVAQQPKEAEDLGKALGTRTNSLTPQDLERMLDNMKSLSASGARDAARAELSKLQQIMESLTTKMPQLSEQQKADLDTLKTLKDIERNQQNLLDKTFRQAQEESQPGDKKENTELAGTQSDLRERLQKLMKGKSEAKSLGQGAEAMARAEKTLRANNPDQATAAQNDALKALKEAEQSVADGLRASLFNIPQSGSETSEESNNVRFTGTAEGNIPDHAEAKHVREILDEIQRRAGDLGRSKTERDYIERLLQNF